MNIPLRVPPSWVRDRLRESHPPLFVCAYDEEARCSAIRLPGALTLGEFRARQSELPRDQEIVFY